MRRLSLDSFILGALTGALGALLVRSTRPFHRLLASGTQLDIPFRGSGKEEGFLTFQQEYYRYLPVGEMVELTIQEKSGPYGWPSRFLVQLPGTKAIRLFPAYKGKSGSGSLVFECQSPGMMSYEWQVYDPRPGMEAWQAWHRSTSYSRQQGGVLEITEEGPGAAISIKWGHLGQPGVGGTVTEIERTEDLTIFPAAAFDIFLRGLHSRTSAEIEKWLGDRKDESFWGDCDKIEAKIPNPPFEFINNGVEFRFNWRVEDLLDNIPPFGDCDCDVGLRLRLNWRFDGQGQYAIYLGDVLHTDFGVGCPACPLHTLGITIYQLLNAFTPIEERRELSRGTAELNEQVQRQVQIIVETGPSRIPTGATLLAILEVTVLRLWVEGGNLKGTIRYRIRIRN